MITFELIYFASSTITKCAIAFTILRLTPQRKYVYIMRANMALMTLTFVGSVAFVLSNCRPFAATWNPLL